MEESAGKQKITITEAANGRCNYTDEKTRRKVTYANRGDKVEWDNKTDITITLTWERGNPTDTEPIKIPAKKKTSATIRGDAADMDYPYNGAECPDPNSPGPKIEVPPPPPNPVKRS
jgi:hypothetical protein